MKKILKKIPGVILLAQFFRIVFVPRQRSEWLLQREKPANLFQPVSQTAFDRFPRVFSFVRDRLEGVPSPRILSFGCSTGEEVFTLRKYFPEAEIVGIDINKRSIAVCRKKLKKNGDSKIRFKVAESASTEPAGHYDAIFCMSVLRHGGLSVSCPESCDGFIRFGDFENTVSGLARVLKPGGYFAIRASNFRFSDTADAAGFDVVLNIWEAPRADTPIYDPDNRLLPGLAYNEVIFCKLPAG